MTLDTQYRMIKPICEIVSFCFYADENGVGGLKTGRTNSPQWYEELPYPLNFPVTWIDSGIGAKRTRESSQGRRSIMNEHEAEVILHLIKLMCSASTLDNLKRYVSDEKHFPIGIITMYQQQKTYLKTELSKAEWAAGIRDFIKIDTVDSYQGQENRLVFLSLVRDNDSSNQGFLGDSSRINVALSRAQERLIIVGARSMWRTGNSDSALAKVLSFVEAKNKEMPELYQIVDGTTVIEGSEHV
ncbi:ATP-binding protein [Edaphovirga cremea]|uniref:ATP-binding protein n=1 Tax=Edaphovirga cremea TaxID=2267246 RepID=UPI003989E70D